MINGTMAVYGLSDPNMVYARDYHVGCTAGRILSQEKGIYRLISEKGEQFAEISGKLRYHAKRAADFPAVGDFVVADCNSFQGKAVIHEILPRKSVFIRKAAGTGNTEQVVAANIDTVFICMSLNRDFNLRRLERYLAVAWESGASPVIVLTKSDLCSDPEAFISSVEQIALGTDILLTSAMEQDGMVIDTPGMRELGLWDTGEGLEQSFSDIEALAAMCRFRNCSHTDEPHCAVQEAIAKGELSKERFQSYQKLKTENRYTEDTEGYLAEKKQKFKNIAKANKSFRRR